MDGGAWWAAVQEQEDLGEGGRVLQGEYPVEGAPPWELWDPAEGVAS